MPGHHDEMSFRIVPLLKSFRLMPTQKVVEGSGATDASRIAGLIRARQTLHDVILS
jgi:hypothetical protein